MNASSHGFEALYRANVGFVIHTLRRLGVAERHLEDIAHDVFVAVHRHLGAYDPGRPLKPWLFGFCYRARLDHGRRASTSREVLEGDAAEEVSTDRSPEDDAFASEVRGRVLGALSRLPDEQRAVLVLHDIEEVSVPEIARTMSVPANTAYSRLRLARRAFEAALREYLTPRSIAAYAGEEPA